MDDLEDFNLLKSPCHLLQPSNSNCSRAGICDKLQVDQDCENGVVGKREICLRKRRMVDTEFANWVRHSQQANSNIFSSITSIDLSRNRLSTFPVDFAISFPLVVQLNLSGNLLKEFPECLANLKSLRSLNLTSNRLAGAVPPSMPQSTQQLAVLRLGDNKLTSFPREMRLWTELEVLSVGDTLGGNNFTQLAPGDSLKYLQRLVEIDFSNNMVDSLPNDWPVHLKSLNLYGNKLVDLPASISQCQELKYLNVARNRLTSLPVELVDLHELDNLDCSGNWLCILPEEITRFMQKTTLLIAGNPITKDQASNMAMDVSRPTAHVAVEYEQSCPPQSSPRRDNLFLTDLSLKNLPSWATVMPCNSLQRKLSRKQSQKKKQKLFHSAFQQTLRGLDALSVSSSNDTSTMVPKLQISHHFTSPMPSPPPFTPRPVSGPPSLLELCARLLIYQGKSINMGCLPQHLRDYLSSGARSCALCGMPYVREWVSDVVVKQFLGTPNVRRRVRYCGWNCWSAAQSRTAPRRVVERPPILAPNLVESALPSPTSPFSVPAMKQPQTLPKSFSESNVLKSRFHSHGKSLADDLMKPKWSLYCTEVKTATSSYWQCKKKALPAPINTQSVHESESSAAILSPLVDSLDSASSGYRWEYDSKSARNFSASPVSNAFNLLEGKGERPNSAPTSVI